MTWRRGLLRQAASGPSRRAVKTLGPRQTKSLLHEGLLHRRPPRSGLPRGGRPEAGVPGDTISSTSSSVLVWPSRSRGSRGPSGSLAPSDTRGGHRRPASPQAPLPREHKAPGRGSGPLQEAGTCGACTPQAPSGRASTPAEGIIRPSHALRMQGSPVSTPQEAPRRHSVTTRAQSGFTPSSTRLSCSMLYGFLMKPVAPRPSNILPASATS